MMRKSSNAWNIAPQGSFLVILSVLPWLYVAFDFIGNCRHGPSAEQEMYLSRLQPITPFQQILDNVTSDKRASHYGAFYSLYLDPLRRPQLTRGDDRIPIWENQEVNLLTVGRAYGDSLQLWKRAFPRGVIYGIANDTTSSLMLQAAARDPRVRLMVGDQANGNFLQKAVSDIKNEVGLLDFIVDDGSHTIDQQQTSLKHLLPLVKPGGTYFIENVETSYTEGIPEGDTTMHVMQSLLDAMNKEFFEKQVYFKNMAHGKFYATPVEKLVGSAGFISFEAIVNQGTSDKRTHHYGAFYSLYLDPLRLPLQPETPANCQQPQPGEDDHSQYTQNTQDSQEQQPWEPRAVNMLEIGLKYGDSLKLWKRAFPRGRIYGIDNEMISKVSTGVPRVNMLEIGLKYGDSPKLLKRAFTRGRMCGIDHEMMVSLPSLLTMFIPHHPSLTCPCLSQTHPLFSSLRRSSPQKHQAEARDPRVRLMVGDQANGTFLEQVVAEIKNDVECDVVWCCMARVGLKLEVGWDGITWVGRGGEERGWDGMGWDGLGCVGGMGWEGKLRKGKGREEKGKGRDGVGWDGMGWDGMGWEGMGWDGMG
ncbi:unnamed protein product [Closterium sp. NIES-65]|nr:unnamed protein product [Closterium sp. NIES-65]